MLYSSVIRIFATTLEVDYDNPWQSDTPSSGTGSGVVVGSGKILTGAHVVANSTFLQVQKASDPNKFTAQILSICHDSDLAILEVKEPNFMEGICIAEIGDLPSLQDRVTVVGYPIGGREISVTEGVVSRIEVQRYSHSRRHLLAVTVDAAINEGNSGGPVFKEDKVIGIAFQTLKAAENIGELVPSNLIHRFIKKSQDVSIVKVPHLGIRTQNMENPMLRSYKKLSSTDSGILLTTVQYGGSAWKTLMPEDVLVEIDGYKIANNGTIKYRDQYRTMYEVVMGDHFVDDEISLKVIRQGNYLDVNVVLKECAPLIPFWSYDNNPTYFIYGGLVFQKLCLDYIATWNKWWDKAPVEFLDLFYSGVRTEERQEVVILAQVLSDEVNVGYQNISNEVVAFVNDTRPKNMIDFVTIMTNAKDTITVKTSGGRIIICDAKQVSQANKRIVQNYHINGDRSLDLIDI
ncbi:S1C family serine protease [Candidatus Uabimicrobium sp. HlEnr_7]|uniref:S1C family serine protease n=1 Tax=Candidatus Uabimicrobium helgolandensis TaxID=3095367 RepID=UPI00355642BD